MPWTLLFKNLFAHPFRTLLTVGSLVVAVFLLCFLRASLVSLDAGVASASSNRLMVQSAVSLFVDLPLSYQGKIENVEGVARTCKLQWFGGIYRDPSNFFAQFAVDADRFAKAYPEVELTQGSQEAFRANRTGCLIGEDLAKRFGWKLGSKIPLQGTIFPKTNGRPWELVVEGIYKAKTANVDNQTLWFHHAYLDETLVAGQATGPRGVGVYVVALDRGASVERVASQIEDLFRNGPQRVQGTTEAEFQRQFVDMLGSVPTLLGSIGGGVLFAILFAVLNTMLLAARERTHDLGVMKALGFSDAVAFWLLLGESLLVCGIGGALGVLLAWASQGAVGSVLKQLIPTYEIGQQTVVEGLLLAIALGLVAGIIPAWQASRLGVVEALRGEG